jgi:uncharacterized membrane protein
VLNRQTAGFLIKLAGNVLLGFAGKLPCLAITIGIAVFYDFSNLVKQ